MKIFFFRHGETIFNTEDKFQGIANSPLSEKGIKQAEKISEIVHSNKVRKFYLSPALRVIQTYEIASQNMLCEKEIDPRLRECCYGDWDGQPRSEILPETLEIRSKSRFTFIHPGEYQGIKGESYAMVYERVLPFLESLTSTQANDDICVISHNGVMMAILKFFLKKENEEMNQIRINNEDYFVWNFDTKEFQMRKL